MLFRSHFKTCCDSSFGPASTTSVHELMTNSKRAGVIMGNSKPNYDRAAYKPIFKPSIQAYLFMRYFGNKLLVVFLLIFCANK